MRLPAPTKSQPVRTEQIILFRVSGQLFGVSSASVKEVRSVDTLAGAAQEISQAGLRKVRHIVQRGEHSFYVVNGAMHFGLPAFAPALVFVLRRTRTALLVDGIEKMTTMTRLQALPQAFCNEERDWYRGVTAIDQTVVPVVKPEGFLTPDELFLLDSSLQPKDSASAPPDSASSGSAASNAAGGPPSVFEGGGLESTFTTTFPDEPAPLEATSDAPVDSEVGAAPLGFKGADLAPTDTTNPPSLPQ
jgi:chemotaxis signal transduction protein